MSDSRVLSLFSVRKRGLLFVSFLVWAFAGSMLLRRALIMIDYSDPFIAVKVIVSIILGVLFFFVVFNRISSRNIVRIRNMEAKKHLFLSFFRWQSYVMMVLMIALGIALRNLGIVPLPYLGLFYFIMATPLLISSVRFLL